MIDIHCHILPGIDDGAAHEQASLKMAQQALTEGITKIIATPHHNNGTYLNPREEVLGHVSALNLVYQEAEIPLEVLPGQEPRISGELLSDYGKGDVLTLNDGRRYLFVELPHDHVPRYIDRLLYDIQLKGLTPIIVHPERNREILQSPGWLYKVVKDGALSQITASSVTGHFGKMIRKLSFDLIEHNLTHFVASDAHNTGSRTFRLREAYETIEDEFGLDVRYLFQENAELLVDGQMVNKDIPQHIKKKKFFGLLKR